MAASFVSKLDLTDDLLLRPFGVRAAYHWRSAYLVSLSGAATGIHNDTYADLGST